MECTRGLAMRFLSVCLSVRLSVCQTRALWQNGKKLSRFLYHAKDHSVWFSEKKNGGWGVIPSIWNFGSNSPHWSEIADFEPIIARSASAEKSSINTIMKSPMRFPTSLRWSPYVAPKSPKRGLKNAKRPFFLYNRTSIEESLLQSFFVWQCMYKVYQCFIFFYFQK